ncbi:MAG: hypothetical protein HKO13_10260 [Sphingomonas sp.]|nr:hypothetical protein [Sphingomonas sp.]RZV52547.1 MAG: hypothetical protein EX258_01970 [Sphingomonadaceae bacterium]
MISFLTTEPRAPQHDPYTEALDRLGALRASVEAIDPDNLEVRDMPGQVPSASAADKLAYAEAMEAAARDGLAAITLAARVDGKRATTLADNLRATGVDLHRILSL